MFWTFSFLLLTWNGSNSHPEKAYFNDFTKTVTLHEVSCKFTMSILYILISSLVENLDSSSNTAPTYTSKDAYRGSKKLSMLQEKQIVNIPSKVISVVSEMCVL